MHATRTVGRRVGAVAEQLRSDGTSLAERATESAVRDANTDGDDFLDPVDDPSIDTRIGEDGPALLTVRWNDDGARWPPPGRYPFATMPTSSWWHTSEERSGWPTLTLELIVSPATTGTRLTLLSTRAPGADPTSNRIDKQQRDRRARQSVARFLDALVDQLEGSASAPAA